MSEKIVKRAVETMEPNAQMIVRAKNALEGGNRALLFRTTLILFSAGFAILTFLVKTVPSFAIDLQITRAIQLFDSPVFTFLMKTVSWPGFGPQSLVIAALTALLLYGLGLQWEAVMALLAAILPMAINLLVKLLVQRPRPPLDLVQVFVTLHNYSFPSGHVMFYLGFFGFIGFLVFSLMKSSFKRILILTLLGLPVVLIGASRIYLGAHWASDVLGAHLLGTLVLIVIVQIYLWGRARLFFNEPGAAEMSKTKRI
jgi:membrane-associated phospholipid phosphatase